MAPIDIAKVLTAAAPIAASLASIATANNSENTIIERKETQQPSVTNNISITVNNQFYPNAEKDAMKFASQMQNELISAISSGTRYTL